MDKPNNSKKNIAILGSTGSIGVQALEVIDQFRDHFQVEVLVAHSNAERLIQQSLYHLPNTVVIGDEDQYTYLQKALEDKNIKVFAGEKAIHQIVHMDTIHLVLNAIVGFAGLQPTLEAIRAQKTIALANKESLVIAGELIHQTASGTGSQIIPVDSEHSAIYQCLTGEASNPIEKIYLTASGGPFRNKDLKSLESVTPGEALQHPNWNMGRKITIDSATLLNKGLEVIEAKWLFNLTPSQIDVLIHPQSVIHSVVQFKDSSMKAQMGIPDMKLPILYALSYPQRLQTDFPRLNFQDYPQLQFETPDMHKFPALQLAYDAMKKGGNMACSLNAANEIAVKAFLNEDIHFPDIARIIAQTMQKTSFIRHPSTEDYIQTNTEARRIAWELVNPSSL